MAGARAVCALLLGAAAALAGCGLGAGAGSAEGAGAASAERAESASVERVTDGDTVVTSAGIVRVIGIDTPERGRCGYREATELALDLVPAGSRVTLIRAPDQGDADRHGRLLRYIETADGADLGLAQIRAGLAVARYDSSDGYGAHPRQDRYREADRAVDDLCPGW